MEMTFLRYIKMFALNNLMNYTWGTVVQISHTVHFSECQIRRPFDRYHKSVRRLLMYYFDTFMNLSKRRFDTYILFHHINSVNIFARISLFILSVLTAFHYIQIDGNFVILSFKSHPLIFAHDATAVLSRHVQKCSNMIVRIRIAPKWFLDRIRSTSEDSGIR